MLYDKIVLSSYFQSTRNRVVSIYFYEPTKYFIYKLYQTLVG